MKIALLATGTELLDGRIQDQNGPVLAKKLASFGLRLHAIHCCGDTDAEISSALKTLVLTNDMVVISGGLGPTEADQTRQAFGIPLEYDAYSEKKLRQLVASRGRPWSDTLLRQCYLPDGAKRFDNPVGSADPFVILIGSTTVIAVPGVPREFVAIVDSLIIPQVIQLADRQGQALEPLHENTFRIFGLSESAVAECLKKSLIPKEVETLIRADFPEIQVILRSKNKDTLDTSNFEANLPQGCVFSHSLAESFETVLVELLATSNKTIGVAESCTGGLVSSLITKVPGSSAVFKGSIISYANEIKSEVLGVPPEILEKFGAVSAECAEVMARQVRQLCDLDIGLSVTGVAGPGGGSVEKPVGTVFIGLATPDCTSVFKLEFPDERERIQRYSAFAALEEVRRNLLQLPARLNNLR